MCKNTPPRYAENTEDSTHNFVTLKMCVAHQLSLATVILSYKLYGDSREGAESSITYVNLLSCFATLLHSCTFLPVMGSSKHNYFSSWERTMPLVCLRPLDVYYLNLSVSRTDAACTKVISFLASCAIPWTPMVSAL